MASLSFRLKGSSQGRFEILDKVASISSVVVGVDHSVDNFSNIDVGLV